jgi:hypothetical protein
VKFVLLEVGFRTSDVAQVFEEPVPAGMRR